MTDLENTSAETLIKATNVVYYNKAHPSALILPIVP
jgi:hypothetical protein